VPASQRIAEAHARAAQRRARQRARLRPLGWALIAIVAAGVAYLYTAAQPSVYNSSTTLSVSGEPLEYFLDLAAKNRLAPLKPIITSGEVATRAATASASSSE
jgi:hypothetical protein